MMVQCVSVGNCNVSQPVKVKTLPMSSTAISAAQGQFLMFNAWYGPQPSKFSFTLNGHAYSFGWPYPFKSPYTNTINSFMFPVKAADLVAGENEIVLWSDQYLVLANINIVLAGAGGVPPAINVNQISSK